MINSCVFIGPKSFNKKDFEYKNWREFKQPTPEFECTELATHVSGVFFLQQQSFTAGCSPF